MNTASAIDLCLADLVHDSVRKEPVTTVRHRRFIISRLVAGALSLAALPVFVVLRGAPSTIELVVFAFMILPIAAGLLVSRTGNLLLGHLVSTIALAGVLACLATAPGGIGAAAAIWLVALPIEPLLTDSRRSGLAASGVAGSAILLVALAHVSGLAGTIGSWPDGVAVAVFALVAAAHAGAVVVALFRGEDELRDARRAHEERVRGVLGVIDDLVTWHDRNGHVAHASPAAMKLLGVPPGALHERGLLARVHIQDRPAFLKAISDAAVGHQPVSTTLRVHFGDALSGELGRVIWIEMRAYRLDPEADQPGNVVCVLRDVCQQKSHEDDLEAARAKAEHADEVKGRFLAVVSHELRTPLNAIIGFSEILASDTMIRLDQEQRRSYARIVHESGHHLLEVVNSLLDMSKIETGNFDFSPAPFDAAGLMSGCLDLMRLKADGVGVDLRHDIEAGLPEVIADRRACRQIFINLISNAIKFTPKGGRVLVSMRRHGGNLAVTIADTGVGVAEGDLRKLGNPFFQANSSYDRAHEGTGLGLSVVRGLVGLHHGALSIESAPGEGTSVTVELPIEGHSGRPVLGSSPIPIRTHARRAGSRSPAAPAVSSSAGSEGPAPSHQQTCGHGAAQANPPVTGHASGPVAAHADAARMTGSKEIKRSA